ncbi:MAG: hypothetical protein INF93_11915 [Rhodobacter sp.]|nr:hypothetical protein [Rhodobacter sp.]
MSQTQAVVVVRMFDPNALSGWATVYAAIVATGALFLEVRRWFESGTKLSLSYMLDAITFPQDGDTSYIVITVANRGDTATTITNLGFQAYETRLHRFRKKASKTFIANRPSQVQPIPHFVEPGGRWMGTCIQTEEVNRLLDNGLLWAEIYATHADKPTVIRLKRRPKPVGKKLDGARVG